MLWTHGYSSMDQLGFENSFARWPDMNHLFGRVRLTLQGYHVVTLRKISIVLEHFQVIDLSLVSVPQFLKLLQRWLLWLLCILLSINLPYNFRIREFAFIVNLFVILSNVLERRLIAWLLSHGLVPPRVFF